MKKIYPGLVLLAGLFVMSCTKSESDNPAQTIITSDSSSVSGRLYVDVFNSNGTSKIGNAVVNLYLSFDDMRNDIPLYTFSSNNSGRVDFGYILQGNYYITGFNGVVADSTVGQVLPRRTTTRKLFLH